MAVASGADVIRVWAGRLRVGRPQVVGGLTLFPVYHDGPTLEYLTLQEAQKAGTIKVSEVGWLGSVSTLKVKSTAPLPVLLQEGDIMLGLKQNRVLNVTILVPPQTTLKVPVACVEAGRWSRSTMFAKSAAYSLSPSIRSMQRGSVATAARHSGTFDGDQGQVWSQVSMGLQDHGVRSGSTSYYEIENKRRTEIEGQVGSLRPEPGQKGVLAFVGGRPASLDVFDRESTLVAMWEGLIGSYIVDAMVSREARDLVDSAVAARWLRALFKGETTNHPAVGVGEMVMITGAETTATGLVVEGVPVHVAAGPLPGATAVRRSMSRA